MPTHNDDETVPAQANGAGATRNPTPPPIDIDECEFTIIKTTDPPVSIVLDYYKQLREYVQHEDNLINFRVTWSLTIHGVLLATYAVIFQKMLDVFSKLSDAGSRARPDPAAGVLLGFQLLIVVIGVWTSSIARLQTSVSAEAINRIDKIARTGLLSIREPGMALLQSDILLPRIIGGGSPYRKFAPAKGYWLNIPFALGIVWLILFFVSTFVFCRYPVWADSSVKASTLRSTMLLTPSIESVTACQVEFIFGPSIRSNC
jgi:hypothetical protein